MVRKACRTCGLRQKGIFVVALWFLMVISSAGAWAFQVEIVTPPSTPSPCPVATNQSQQFECVIAQDQAYSGAYWYHWDFGDGTVVEGSDKNITQHIYTTDGAYVVHANVRHEPDDSLSASATVTLAVTSSTARSITLTATPSTLDADGQSTSTLLAVVTDGNSDPVPDGSVVVFSTDWGTLYDSQSTPPQTLQATTTNGQATATLIAGNTVPANGGAFTLSAISGFAYAVLQAQAQQAAAAPGNLVVHCVPPSPNICAKNHDTVAGCAWIHLFVVVSTGDLVGFTSMTEEARHGGQQTGKTWSSTDEVSRVSYTDPNAPNMPACAPAFQENQVLWDFMIKDGWHTDGYHNGAWTIAARYSTARGAMDPPHNYAPAIQVTLANLILTMVEDGNHPPLLKWFGSENPNNKTGIAFTLESANTSPVVATIKVYPLPRSDTTAPIRTYTQDATSPSAQPVEAEWDGKGDNGQPVASGLYAFDVSASWAIGACPCAQDTKTSGYLSLYLLKVNNQTKTCVEYLGYNTNSNKQQFKVTYVLKDTAGTAASVGHIDLYKPDLSSVSVKTLSDSDLTASANGSEHNVTVEVGNSDLGYPGTFRFVVFATDNRANDEKGHRKKPALEAAQELDPVIESVTWDELNPGEKGINLFEDNPNAGGGWRIFPDKNSDDGPTHQQVLVVVKITPDLENFPVWVQSFDVDDPSSNSPPVDDETKTKDNRGSPKDGSLGTAISITTGTKAANTAGIAKTPFTVTMNPGDNFRVVSAIKQDDLGQVSVPQSVTDGHVNDGHGNVISDNETTLADLKASPMLTVWRKLHVEVDSMGKEYDTGNSTALTETVLTDTGKNWTTDQFHSYDEPWRLNPNTGSARWYNVAGNTATTITVTNGDPPPPTMVTDGAIAGNPYRVEFTGFEADHQLRGEIPQPDTGALQAAFAVAYIAMFFDTGKDDTSTPCNCNM